MCPTHRPNKLKYWNMEKRKVYCRAKWGECVALLTPWWLGGDSFLGKIWGEGGRECDFLLRGRWWGNRAVLQESGAEPVDTILHLNGALVPAELNDKVPWGGIWTLPQGSTLVSWLLFSYLFIPSLPWLATIELPFGTLRKSRRLKEAYFLPTRNGDTEKICTQEPHRVLLSFKSAWKEYKVMY